MEFLSKPSSLSKESINDKLLQALYSFLAGKSLNTSKCYKQAIQAFIDELGGKPKNILMVDSFLITKYKETLLENNSISTVANRLSALSAMYQYLMRLGLINSNPVRLIDRDDLRVNPYEHAKKISVDQFNSILEIIPDTLIGVRDRAIFLMICINGLRRASIINLLGSDIEFMDGKVFFRTKLKGGKSDRKEMPLPIWNAVLLYLQMDGRVIENYTPIFLPTRDSGDYLLAYYGRNTNQLA